MNTFAAIWCAMMAFLAGGDATTTAPTPPPPPVRSLEVTPAPDHPVAPVQTAGIVCDIKKTTDKGQTVLVAYISSATANSGNFDFAIQSQSTKTRQKGSFSLKAGESQALRTVRLGGDAAVAASGKLSVTWNGGQKVSCSL